MLSVLYVRAFRESAQCSTAVPVCPIPFQFIHTIRLYAIYSLEQLLEHHVRLIVSMHQSFTVIHMGHLTTR